MLQTTRPKRPLLWHPCVEALREAVPAGQEVYLVGGVVRDAYLHRPSRDIDLATPEDGQHLARHIANHFGGAYYPLDPERGVGRALIVCDPHAEETITVDVARFRGPNLLTDLQGRDFTLNAMAVRLGEDLEAIFDPLGGLADLEAKRLRQCTPHAIADDPVRALRAIRASVTFRLLIEPQTRASIKAHAHALAQSAPERVRDELFHILAAPRPWAAIDAAQRLGVLQHVIPETAEMQDVPQPPPHQHDLWQHTLRTMENLDTILRAFQPEHSDNLTANIQAGAVAFALAHLRKKLQAHLAHRWPNERSHHALLMLAALLHDVGKPQARVVDEQGKLHFWKHEHIGAKIVERRARALRLSKEESARLATIVRHHMRPHWLSDAPKLTRRAVYRFWRATDQAGVDVCLLAMADYLATYGVKLDTQAWTHYLETVQALLEAFLLRKESAVAPPPLLDGRALIAHLGLSPGPQIGKILDGLQEAQAVGEVRTKEEALAWAQRFLAEQNKGKAPP